MTNVKKAFLPVVDLLEANRDKKVSIILPEVIALCEAKGRGSSENKIYRDSESNEIVAIFCGYFRQWMPLSHIEFGEKASSSTGFNAMSKEGQSNWSRQNAAAKKAQGNLLNDAIAGDVAQSDLAGLNEEIEAERTAIVPHSTGIGFDTVEELLDFDVAELDRLVEAVAVSNDVEFSDDEDQVEAA